VFGFYYFTPYWIFGSTVERSRRRPAMMAAMANGSDVIAQAGNSPAHGSNYTAYNETQSLTSEQDIDMGLDLVRAFDLDTDH